MSQEGRARDLFIVDNSACGCTKRHYPQGCPGIAETFDIASGRAA